MLKVALNNEWWFMVFFSKFLGAWWIVDTYIRLEGDPKYHGCRLSCILTFFANIGSGLQHHRCWFMAFWSNSFGALVDCYLYEYEVGRGPKKTWAQTAIYFGLSSQRWKRPSTLPLMVYGALVQNILGSRWIVELNMRLWGNPNPLVPPPIHFGLPSQHWKQPLTPPMLV